MTDVINPALHAELKEMIDKFAVHPYGFLGLDPTTFRLCIGYTEIVLALTTLAPSKPHREWAYNMLGIIMCGAMVAHMTVKDGKEFTPMMMLLFIVYLRFYDFVANFSAAYAAELEKKKTKKH